MCNVKFQQIMKSTGEPKRALVSVGLPSVDKEKIRPVARAYSSFIAPKTLMGTREKDGWMMLKLAARSDRCNGESWWMLDKSIDGEC